MEEGELSENEQGNFSGYEPTLCQLVFGVNIIKSLILLITSLLTIANGSLVVALFIP